MLLRTQISKEIAPEQFHHWIRETYQLSSESIEVITAKSGQTNTFSWKKDAIWYTAVLEKSVLVDVVLLNEGRAMSADHTIACLGAPERYRALYERIVEGTQLSLDMLFPAQGILAAGAQFPRSMPKQPPAINGDFPIRDFRFVQPGSAEEVLRRVFYTNDVYESALREYRSWPGNWQDIVIEIAPSIYW